MSTTIHLPQPRRDSPVSLEAALHGRQSTREYSNLPLALTELSQLLWSAAGVKPGSAARATPSAGAQYPLHVYVAVGAVERLPIGLYAYSAGGHALARHSANDLRPALGHAAIGDQPWLLDAAAVLLVMADMARMTTHFQAQPPAGERGARYAYIETGAVAENVSLQAAALGLGAVLVGGFDDQQVQATMSERKLQPTALLCIGRERGGA